MGKMIEIPFNVSARTARLIGRENVSNAEGAIIELVKNCYDADASQAEILFDGDSIYIVDNGDGMDEAIIRDVWMNIGTDDKKANPLSSKNRIKTGAKGIGRFALDRLGDGIEMYTLSKGSSTGFRWDINWSSFEDAASTVISDIKARLETLSTLNLNDKLPARQSSKINFENCSGTIIKISQLRDKWDKDALDNLFSSLELLVPIVEGNSFSISLLSDKHPDSFGLVKPLIDDDFDFRISALYESSTKKLTVEIARKEFDVNLIQKQYSRVFEEKHMKNTPYTFPDFKKKILTKQYDVNEVLPGYSDDEGLLGSIGDISFNFIFAKNLISRGDKAIYPYRTVDYAARSAWLDKFSGVRIFRDNFRVRPYGEKGNDWLGLGPRQAKSPQGAGQRLGAYRFRPNQVSGSVHISQVRNPLLVDTSSREGLQENTSFELLKELVLAIVGLLESDRNIIMYSFRELWKKTNEEKLKKEKGQSAAIEIRKAVSNNDAQVGTELAADVVQANEVLIEEIKEKDAEGVILRGLASAGLVTAALAHELRGIENILLARNQDLKKLISEYIRDDDLAGVKDAFNPFVLLSDMEKTDKNLSTWLNYALTPLKRDMRKTKLICISDYFTQHMLSIWGNILKERQINIKIEKFSEDFRVKMFTIDLDTIFNNLIINSIESFSHKKDRGVDREIKINIRKVEKHYEIIFEDNGAGLDPSFRNRPEDIFLPQVTSKRDSKGSIVGTGMGMYLVKKSIEENNGEVVVHKKRDGFALLMKLLIPHKG